MNEFLITETAVAAIRAAAQRALPSETGGVLIGVRVNGRPWVERAVEIPDPRATPTHYRLDGARRRSAIADARSDDRRLGYVGEWHSHPADVGPSTRDRLTMTALAVDPRAGTKTPLLLIARHRSPGWTVEPYRVLRGVLRGVEPTLTGPLASDPEGAPT